MAEDNTKKGLDALFAPKPPQTEQRQVTAEEPVENREKKEISEEVKVTINITSQLNEKIRNYQYSYAINTGNIGYSLRNVIEDAIELLCEKSKFKIVERPEEIRRKEKNRGRGASKK
jgi:hypothetical protein